MFYDAIDYDKPKKSKLDYSKEDVNLQPYIFFASKFDINQNYLILPSSYTLSYKFSNNGAYQNIEVQNLLVELLN